MHGQHEDFGVRGDLAQQGQRFQTAQRRHGQIEQDQIRLSLLGEGERLSAVAGLRHNAQIRLRTKQEAQADAKDGVIVGEQNSGDGHRGSLS